MATPDSESDSPVTDPRPDAPDPPHHLRDDVAESLHQIVDAAKQAEVETGYHEETEEEIRRSLARRMARAIIGFIVIGIGIVALPLPGPGWLIIIFGLSLLPFAWAERTIVLIRQKIPGVPDEGKIPVRTWIIMGVIVVGASTIALFWGKQIGNWFFALF